MNNRQKGAAFPTKLAVIAAICGILAIAVTLLPKGFKDDLSLIGQGKPSVVLVFDKNLVGSTEMMELLNKVRPEYEDKITFLAVDIDTPVGHQFSRQQGTANLDLVAFGPTGDRLNLQGAVVDERTLRSALNDI